MSDTQRVYPAAPLVISIKEEQQNALLTQSPPTYDQATGAAPANTTETDGSGPTVVLVTQPNSTIAYGPYPIDVQCPFCHNFTRTHIRHQPNSRTHLFAMILCLLQLYCCICIPYCIPSCMNTNHYCGMCDIYLGTYKRN